MVVGRDLSCLKNMVSVRANERRSERRLTTPVMICEGQKQNNLAQVFERVGVAAHLHHLEDPADGPCGAMRDVALVLGRHGGVAKSGPARTGSRDRPVALERIEALGELEEGRKLPFASAGECEVQLDTVSKVGKSLLEGHTHHALIAAKLL